MVWYGGLLVKPAGVDSPHPKFVFFSISMEIQSNRSHAILTHSYISLSNPHPFLDVFHLFLSIITTVPMQDFGMAFVPTQNSDVRTHPQTKVQPSVGQ